MENNEGAVGADLVQGNDEARSLWKRRENSLVSPSASWRIAGIFRLPANTPIVGCATLHVQHVIVDPLPGGWGVEIANLSRMLERAEEDAREKLNRLLTDGEKKDLQGAGSEAAPQTAQESSLPRERPRDSERAC